MDNISGCVGFMSVTEPTYYETILYILVNEMVDIYNTKRVINSEIKVPSRVMPRTSGDGHLHTIVEDSIVKCKDTIKNENGYSLKRTIFDNKVR